MRHSRLSAALLLLIAACSSGGTDNNNPGTIALALSSNGASVAQGGNVPVTATLTRGGGFTGTVNLTVSGVPTGVTAVVSNIVTTGTTTTATVTINVAASTLPGTYPLVVHGTGSGVTEATANYQLIVTARPAVALSLSTATPSITLGSGTLTATSTVTLTRTNFTGDVTLSVDNLPTGVTASFVPPNPQSGTSSVLTLTAGSTAVAGTFNTLAVRATGAGIDPVTTPLTLTIAPPTVSFTLSLTNATLTIAQGASTPTTTVNINRVNFPGDVALSVLNLPTGVTASFSPVNPQSGNSSVLTLTVDPTAPTGTFTTLSVQGVGTAGTVATPLTLTITAAVPVGNFSLTTTPASSANVTQGNHTDVVVNVVRTGGNTSDVTFSLTGTLPTGLTASFNPTHTTGASTTLTFTATGTTALGPNIVVIHGNAPQLAEQVATFSITVVAPSGSGNASVSFASCAAVDKPVWLAFMDGTSGPWTQVTGVADVYTFNIAQSKGSFAYVTLGGSGGSNIFVQNLTQAELIAGTQSFCPAPPPTGKTVNGTLANLATGFSAQVSFAGKSAVPVTNGPFQILHVPDGSFDLIGYEHDLGTGVGTGDRVFIQRGENPVTNFSVPVDFLDGTRSASAAAAQASLTNLSGSATIFSTTSVSYLTGPACTPSPLYTTQLIGTPFNIYGVPSSLRTAGDMHRFTAQISNGANAFQFLIENFVDVVTRAQTPFVLPTELPVPAQSNAGGFYKRPMLVFTGVPPELNLSHIMAFANQTSPTKSGTVTESQGWVGGSTVTLVLPDFHGVGTFLDSWAPATSDVLSWTASSTGGTLGCLTGQRFLTSGLTGSL